MLTEEKAKILHERIKERYATRYDNKEDTSLQMEEFMLPAIIIALQEYERMKEEG